MRIDVFLVEDPDGGIPAMVFGSFLEAIQWARDHLTESYAEGDTRGIWSAQSTMFRINDVAPDLAPIDENTLVAVLDWMDDFGTEAWGWLYIRRFALDAFAADSEVH